MSWKGVRAHHRSAASASASKAIADPAAAAAASSRPRPPRPPRLAPPRARPARRPSRPSRRASRPARRSRHRPRWNWPGTIGSTPSGNSGERRKKHEKEKPTREGAVGETVPHLAASHPSCQNWAGISAAPIVLNTRVPPALRSVGATHMWAVGLSQHRQIDPVTLESFTEVPPGPLSCYRWRGGSHSSSKLIPRDYLYVQPRRRRCESRSASIKGLRFALVSTVPQRKTNPHRPG